MPRVRAAITLISFVAVIGIYLFKWISTSDFNDYIAVVNPGKEAHGYQAVDMIKNKVLIPPSQLPYNLSTDPDYQRRAVGYSWAFVNDILVNLFDDEYSKFFVEAGGLDGEFLSNTLWLERHRKWSGLLVEPEPRNFEDMVHKRRKCWIAKSCFSTETYPREVTMMSVVRKSNVTALDPEAMRGGTHEVGSYLNVNSYNNLNKMVDKIPFTAQCFPVYSFLLALNRSVIDFFSLDIQGTEAQVFDTLPLDKIYVRTVVIEREMNVLDQALVQRMNQKGFKVLAIGGSPDYFFVNEKEASLIAKHKGPFVQDLIDKGYKFMFS